MPVSEATYERLALEDLESQWEYTCGQIRRKPAMTHEHNTVMRLLGYAIQAQLPVRDFQVAQNAPRTRRPESSYFIPDVMVIPVSLFPETAGTGELEKFTSPLPFVAEVWSKSTGDYDVDTKFAEYKRRGDLEIWRLHPYERSVIAWRRRPDGAYSETRYAFADREAPIQSLPGVVVRFEDIFE
jgi:Uma2 family endonuclease